MKSMEGADLRLENPPKIFGISNGEDINEWFSFLNEKIVENA